MDYAKFQNYKIMSAIEKLLPTANTALLASPVINNDTLTEGVYDGYLAAFGPAVITSGLLPTLSVYIADDKRKKILNLIAEVAAINNTATGLALYQACLNEYSNLQQLNIWREKIINASVALKITIRTFNHNIENE